MKHFRQFLKVALCCAIGIVIAQHGVRAQDYPAKPIRLILPTNCYFI